MKKWLLARLTEEDYSFSPDFAFMGTINWINCLALKCNKPHVLDSTYSPDSNTTSNTLSKSAENRVFEYLFMSQHSLTGLNSIIESVTFPNDICKICVYAWYDCILNSIKAMVICHNGENPKNNMQLEEFWLKLINELDFIPEPFNMQINDLTDKSVKEKIDLLRDGNQHTLNSFASSDEQATGGLISYLSGTIKYYTDREKIKLLESETFKLQNIENFRTKVAQEYRDEHLSNLSISFLSCLTRFKGKVLERDSIFLSYGNVQEDKVSQMLSNLLLVAKCFYDMSEQFCSKNITRGTWILFKADLDENSRLTAML